MLEWIYSKSISRGGKYAEGCAGDEQHHHGESRRQSDYPAEARPMSEHRLRILEVNRWGKFVELMSDIRQSDYERTERLINQVREVLYGHYYRRDNSLLNNQPTISKMVGKTSEVNGLWQDKKYLLQNVTERNVKLL